jgi:type VI secretion system protein ImpI
MALILRIDNETCLPDGGPLSVSVPGKQGIDIGRDQYLDWTLPDPSRFISGRHCEVRWENGGYWLHDVSTNGTFLNGSDSRLKGPHRLRHGDRLSIGHYIILVTVVGDGSDAKPSEERESGPRHTGNEDLWSNVQGAPPPIDPKQLKTNDRPTARPDFLDWASDVPSPQTRATARDPGRPTGSSVDPWDLAQQDSRVQANDDMSWAKGPPKQLQPAPESIPIPQPRRPVWVSGEPGGPWGNAQESGSPASPAPNQPVVTRTSATAKGAPSTVDNAADLNPTAARGLSNPLERAAPGAVVDIDSGAEFLRLVAKGAGLPEDTLASRDAGEVAEQLGQLMRLVSENVKQLLEARGQAKRMTRSSKQTMVQALNNNPLKFAPLDDALAIMLGPPSKSYLDARRALAQGFADLMTHEIKTYSAMQKALALTMAEWDPAAIEKEAKSDFGLASLVGSRKARLWDFYAARWQACRQRHDDGMLSVFMEHFAECYDRDENGLA